MAELAHLHTCEKSIRFYSDSHGSCSREEGTAVCSVEQVLHTEVSKGITGVCRKACVHKAPESSSSFHASLLSVPLNPELPD